MKKKSSAGVIATLVMICILCMTMVAAAGPVKAEGSDETGTVEITAADFAEGTGMGACQVGVYKDGAYVLDEKFKDVDVDLTDLTEASKSLVAANALSEKAAEIANYIVASFDADGKVIYSDLPAENRLYVFFQINNFEVITINPMLVVLPYYNEEDEKVLDVKVDAKYKDNRPEEFFGSIILTKTDPKGLPLEGAEFRLDKKVNIDADTSVPPETLVFEGTVDGEKYTYYWTTVVEKLTSDKHGQIVIKDIPLGEYRFVETKAPAGYVLSTKAVFVQLDKPGSVKIIDDIYVRDEGDPYEVYFENSPEEVSKPSVPESSVPEPSKPNPSEPPTPTGEDISKFIVIGCVVGGSLILVIILLLITKKKKK